MKIKDTENVRKVLLYVYFGTMLVENINTCDIEVINNILNQVDITLFKNTVGTLFDISIVTASRLERLSDDYKEIKEYYNKIIKNTSSLFKDFACDTNLVWAFALFVYLYRNGYLSKNKHFVFSYDTKDLSMLTGVDVVRGHGVCRSISNIFVDILNEIDIDAINLTVNVDKKDFNKVDSLCPKDLEYESQKQNTKGPSIKVSSSIESHVITGALYEDNPYVFDPTHDLLLYPEDNKFIFANDSTASMKYKKEILSKILGQTTNKKDINIFKYTNKQPISYEEYKWRYLYFLKIIKNNADVLEKFYNDNSELYDLIDAKTKDIHSLVRRYLPFY